MKKTLFMLSVLLILLISSMPIHAQTFRNPLTKTFPEGTESPDPYVYKHTDGNYYGMYTLKNAGESYINKIRMFRSKSLVDLFNKGETKAVWVAPSSGWNNKDIWAPELHYINGKFYLYYSTNMKTGVLECSGQDPMNNSWIDRGQLATADDTSAWMIDSTVLQQNGKLYLIYSRWSPQSIYIVEMESPIKLTTKNPVIISRPTLSWEKDNVAAVNEGPEIVKRNGKTFLIFSAAFCHTQYYCLGGMVASDTADPTNTASWTKYANPLFKKSDANGIYSTGHCSLTKSPNDTEDWLIYHASFNSAENQPRIACMKKFTWNTDGSPNFGEPPALSTDIPVPAGDIGSAPTPTPGSPTPAAGLKGDVNSDNSITIVDALMTAQYSVGLNPSNFNSSRADVNCDGQINIVDALMMAQYYVGLIGSFC